MTDRVESQPEIELGSHGVSLTDVVAVARHGARVRIAPEARERVAASRALIERLAVLPNEVTLLLDGEPGDLEPTPFRGSPSDRTPALRPHGLACPQPPD